MSHFPREKKKKKEEEYRKQENAVNVTGPVMIGGQIDKY